MKYNTKTAAITFLLVAMVGIFIHLLEASPEHVSKATIDTVSVVGLLLVDLFIIGRVVYASLK